jgi:hypothetical protein
MGWVKVVYGRDGRREEVAGWRKWSIAIPAAFVAAVVLALVLVIVFGIAITVGAVLLIAVPAAVLLALLARAVMLPRPRGGPPAGPAS